MRIYRKLQWYLCQFINESSSVRRHALAIFTSLTCLHHACATSVSTLLQTNYSDIWSFKSKQCAAARFYHKMTLSASVLFNRWQKRPCLEAIHKWVSVSGIKDILCPLTSSPIILNTDKAELTVQWLSLTCILCTFHDHIGVPQSYKIRLLGVLRQEIKKCLEGCNQ